MIDVNKLNLKISEEESYSLDDFKWAVEQVSKGAHEYAEYIVDSVLSCNSYIGGSINLVSHYHDLYKQLAESFGFQFTRRVKDDSEEKEELYGGAFKDEEVLFFYREGCHLSFT